MENRKTCRNAQCFCDGSCQDLIKSDINYTSVIPMENKTAEEIYELAERLMQSESLEASAIILRDFAEKCYQEGAVDAQNDAAKAMEEYASQQLAEKDKVIERLKRRKLVHQLFIGKVADILSVEKAQELLRESNESLNKMI